MNAEERLAELYAELVRLGLRPLVMGGHAVRYHGVDRSTFDYDLCLALDDQGWIGLPQTLAASPVIGGPDFHEGSSWRPSAFRRFIVGRLPDGREERLECWRHPRSASRLLSRSADMRRARARIRAGPRRRCAIGSGCRRLRHGRRPQARVLRLALVHEARADLLRHLGVFLHPSWSPATRRTRAWARNSGWRRKPPPGVSERTTRA